MLILTDFIWEIAKQESNFQAQKFSVFSSMQRSEHT